MAFKGRYENEVRAHGGAPCITVRFKGQVSGLPAIALRRREEDFCKRAQREWAKAAHYVQRELSEEKVRKIAQCERASAIPPCPPSFLVSKFAWRLDLRPDIRENHMNPLIDR